MTPKIFSKYTEAYQKKIETSLGISDMNNYNLGLYIKIAVADIMSGKNNYPKHPLLQGKKSSTLKHKFSKEETEAYIAKMRKGNTDDTESQCYHQR